ncbi:MAG: O-antigen ligase family protein [bacterium]
MIFSINKLIVNLFSGINAKKAQFVLFAGLFFLLRVFSFFYQPGGLVNSVISLFLLTSVIYLLLKCETTGWIFIATEFILGGSGSYLSIGSVSLRTYLLMTTILIFFIKKLYYGDLKSCIRENKTISLIFLLLYIGVAISCARGIVLGNNTNFVISDAIPYLFFLYYYPLKKLTKNPLFVKSCFIVICVTITCTLFLVLATFALFSIHYFELHDLYYNWFRDIAGGKITDMGNHFFRIVLNEQLLLIPLLLYYSFKKFKFGCFEKDPVIKPITIAACLLVLMSINISRSYFLALMAGILVFFIPKNFKLAIKYIIVLFGIIIISFSAIHISASRAQSFGFDLIGLRINSIAYPSIEESSMSRMALLPKILKNIKNNPLIGSGFGTELTVFNPVVNAEVKTRHFDWGFLEIVAEMGIIGSLAWIILLTYLCFQIISLKKRMDLSILASILTINLTQPAIFHVFGVVLLIILLSNITSAQKT